MPSPASSSVTFGCVPHTDDDRTRAELVALSKWLTKELGIQVHPHRSPSPDALASAFANGRVQIAWVSPALLLTSASMASAIPVVCSVRGGMATYHSVLFVAHDAPFSSPSELTGVRAAWVARTSAAGYIVPRLALASHGLDPRTTFSSETFYGTHGNVARAVFEGHADVGATFAVFAEGDATQKLERAGFVDVVENKRGRILYAAGPIPSDPIVVSPAVSLALRADLIRTLAKLSEADESIQKAVMHIIGADTFEAVRPHSFDGLREQIADGRELGILDE